MLCAKLRRAMVNPQREPLCGVVEADETIIPFRTKEDPIVLPDVWRRLPLRRCTNSVYRSEGKSH
jgi:hypothetical protein